jgi:hypothetical protein
MRSACKKPCASLRLLSVRPCPGGVTAKPPIRTAEHWATLPWSMNDSVILRHSRTNPADMGFFQG